MESKDPSLDRVSLNFSDDVTSQLTSDSDIDESHVRAVNERTIIFVPDPNSESI